MTMILMKLTWFYGITSLAFILLFFQLWALRQSCSHPYKFEHPYYLTETPREDLPTFPSTYKTIYTLLMWLVIACFILSIFILPTAWCGLQRLIYQEAHDLAFIAPWTFAYSALPLMFLALCFSLLLVSWVSHRFFPDYDRYAALCTFAQGYKKYQDPEVFKQRWNWGLMHLDFDKLRLAQRAQLAEVTLLLLLIAIPLLYLSLQDYTRLSQKGMVTQTIGQWLPQQTPWKDVQQAHIHLDVTEDKGELKLEPHFLVQLKNQKPIELWGSTGVGAPSLVTLKLFHQVLKDHHVPILIESPSEQASQLIGTYNPNEQEKLSTFFNH